MQVSVCCVLAFCALLSSSAGSYAQGASAPLWPAAVARTDTSLRSVVVVADGWRRPPAVLPSLIASPILPAGAATSHYGFFCKQELKWDKKLPTQLRFRVGSHDACDRLEGKRRD